MPLVTLYKGWFSLLFVLQVNWLWPTGKNISDIKDGAELLKNLKMIEKLENVQVQVFFETVQLKQIGHRILHLALKRFETYATQIDHCGLHSFSFKEK